MNKSASWIRKHWDKTSRKHELISFNFKKRTYYCTLLSFLNSYVLWNILSLFSWVHEWTKEISTRKYLFTYLPKFCTSNGSIRLAPVTIKPEEVYTSGNNSSFNNKVTSLWKLCVKTLLVVLVDLKCVPYICFKT